MNGPSREEFERLYQTIDAGFQGTHDRLDVLNGRTGKGEVAHAALAQRVTSVEKELFSRPRRRAAETPDERKPFLTKRETALVTLGVAVFAAILKLMLLAGEFVFEIAKAAIKVRG